MDYSLAEYQGHRGTHEMRDLARGLRREATSAEQAFWEAVRGGKIDGLRFRRQHVYGTMVLDFYCPSLRLVVEIDGSIHTEPEVAMQDRRREQWLRDTGLRIIRFRNEEVLEELPQVLARLRQAMHRRS